MHLSVEFRTNKEIMGCRCPSFAVNSRKMQPLRRAGPAITRALGSRTPISVSKDSCYLYLKFGKIRTSRKQAESFSYVSFMRSTLRFSTDEVVCKRSSAS